MESIIKELKKYDKYLIRTKIKGEKLIVGIKPTAPKEAKKLFNEYKIKRKEMRERKK